MLNFFLENQQFLYPLLVGLGQDGEVVEIPLLLLGLLRENVAVVSVLSLDFSRSGKREALFGTGVGLKLCHFYFIKLLNYTKSAYTAVYFFT